MKRFLGILLFAATNFLIASENETLFVENVKAEGRTYTHSCGYYSNSEAEARILFRPDPVDYGTRIFIEYGWAGVDASNQQSFSWKNRAEKEMELMERGLWYHDFNQVIAERSSPVIISGLNFAFRIEEPGKAPRYLGGPEKGVSYIAHLIKPENAPCVSAEKSLPEPQNLIVQIER
jgi:hypothetical protein